MTGLMTPLTEAQRLALLPVSETATAECWGAEPIWEIKEKDFGETVKVSQKQKIERQT